MLTYYREVAKVIWKDFRSSVGEQLIGALLVIGILLFQIHFGLIKPEDVRGNLWSICWPYVLLIAGFLVWHLARAPWKVHQDQAKAHSAELQKMRDEYQEALASADKERRELRSKLTEAKETIQRLERKHSKPLDWGGEWKLAEDGFRKHENSDVKAQRQYESSRQVFTWDFSGGSPIIRNDVEAVCARAGALLLSCPGFSDILADEIKVIESDVYRWLEYLHRNHPLSDVFTGESKDAEGNTTSWVSAGYLFYISALSASECVKCASLAMRFKQLW
jgi:hypothetical protein